MKKFAQTSEGLEKFVEFLNSFGVKTELVEKDQHDFSRTIQFTIYKTTYRIQWFVNESRILIGLGNRPAQIPFKYIYFDSTYPLVNQNKSLGFSYTRSEKTGIFDNEFPYEVFRIPLEIEEANNKQ